MKFFFFFNSILRNSIFKRGVFPYLVWKEGQKAILSLHFVLTLRIPACASHMSHFAGCLVVRYSRKLSSLQLLESSYFLSITQPLQLNPTINTWYKRLNRITIKFGTELKPIKHIVVNHNFTVEPKCFLLESTKIMSPQTGKKMGGE